MRDGCGDSFLFGPFLSFLSLLCALQNFFSTPSSHKVGRVWYSLLITSYRDETDGFILISCREREGEKVLPGSPVCTATGLSEESHSCFSLSSLNSKFSSVDVIKHHFTPPFFSPLEVFSHHSMRIIQKTCRVARNKLTFSAFKPTHKLFQLNRPAWSKLIFYVFRYFWTWKKVLVLRRLQSDNFCEVYNFWDVTFWRYF